MRLGFSIFDCQVPIEPDRSNRDRRAAAGPRPSFVNWQSAIGNVRAFTMIEIAICLAIIGFALVSIIAVLPFGMRTQGDNREQTVINQDATMLMEAMRGGAQGLDDLTNYVYAITNYWVEFRNGRAAPGPAQVDGYTYSGSQIRPKPGILTSTFFPLTNGLRIIGLMSMPEYLDLEYNPTNNLLSGGYSNHVVAYVRSMSGPATEKPPQANADVLAGAFSYLVFCVNAPMAMDTNLLDTAINYSGVPPYNQQLAASLHELRLTFLWPLYPAGGVGPGRWTCRTMVGGMIFQTNVDNQWLYFYQPQSFNNVVTTP